MRAKYSFPMRRPRVDARRRARARVSGVAPAILSVVCLPEMLIGYAPALSLRGNRLPAARPAELAPCSRTQQSPLNSTRPGRQPAGMKASLVRERAR